MGVNYMRGTLQMLFHSIMSRKTKVKHFCVHLVHQTNAFGSQYFVSEFQLIQILV